MSADMTHMRILLIALSLGYAGGFSFVMMKAATAPPAMMVASLPDR